MLLGEFDEFLEAVANNDGVNQKVESQNINSTPRCLQQGSQKVEG
jgi:hypothetical protein